MAGEGRMSWFVPSWSVDTGHAAVHPRFVILEGVGRSFAIWAALLLMSRSCSHPVLYSYLFRCAGA